MGKKGGWKASNRSFKLHKGGLQRKLIQTLLRGKKYKGQEATVTSCGKGNSVFKGKSFTGQLV